QRVRVRAGRRRRRGPAEGRGGPGGGARAGRGGGTRGVMNHAPTSRAKVVGAPFMASVVERTFELDMRDGLLLIDKGPGVTSHDVVQRVRRILKQKKIGHCGTLDPDATGLLLLTLGTATRLTRFLIRAPKVYEGTIRLGVATDTYDSSGQVVATASPEAVAALTREQVAEAMRAFEGDIEQKAPPFSAKKVNGVKYYELARRGEEVPDEAKEVTVFELTPLSDLEDGRVRFRLACSSGTYARGLAHDLGAALGVGGHLAELRRMRIGSFAVESAAT